ncbi:SPX domain-containing membrane protein Os09g0521800-like [Dendronephthya gigantea]|uniref:SPX domain-containing membrane protein Os09g0521800-like n=1 Tax=Dendronephthya gigantea TaxID=151771 RepID=UPI00106DC0EA|nr:SPX domain-containing membrane protein Os09g0521800-like [Dendronephthya gigantea]XP_028402647.1 SPX domain-containing membrane protein Os09g0521800-like [Dendronephthya gigantea]
MAKPKSPKLWILVFICVRNFTDGCEAYFIAPTAWYYVKSLGQSKEFLSLVLTSFNLSAVVISPIFGHIADRFGHVKLLIVLSYVVKVVGNLLYSINTSPYFPLMGRIISGMAESSFGILMGQVALHTSSENRAGIFVFLETTYCLGCAFGPAIGSFVTFNADLFGWKINAGNSPGIILTCVWLVSLIASLFLPHDFGEKNAREEVKAEMTMSGTSDSDDERKLSEQDRTLNESETKTTVECNSRVLCLFYLIFWNEVFSSTATFFTPLIAMEILHLRLIHVKFYFLNSSLATLLLFITMYIASNYLREKKIFLFSMLLQISAISLLVILAFTWDDVSSVHYYILLFYVMMGMPYFAFSAGCSLMSKITHPKNAAFYQGTSFAMVHLSIVASRVVAGYVFTRTGLICFSLGLAFFWFIGVIWFGLLYNSFESKKPSFKS